MNPSREEIVRTDFPVVRRGYDRRAVAAHLRRVAASVAGLQREQGSPMAEMAGEKVMDIIGLVEQTAAEIVEQADRQTEYVVERAEAEIRGRVERAEEALEKVISEVQTMRATAKRLGETIEGDIRLRVDELQEGNGAVEDRTPMDVTEAAAVPLMVERAGEPDQADERDGDVSRRRRRVKRAVRRRSGARNGPPVAVEEVTQGSQVGAPGGSDGDPAAT